MKVHIWGDWHEVFELYSPIFLGIMRKKQERKCLICAMSETRYVR
jgi:hypothetical protein